MGQFGVSGWVNYQNEFLLPSQRSARETGLSVSCAGLPASRHVTDKCDLKAVEVISG
jgi:hypothetical protein